MAKIVGKPNADDVKRVAVAALVAALDDGKEKAKKKPGLTGMRAVATGAVLYTAGKVAFNGRRFISERLQSDDEPEEDEVYDDEEDLEEDDEEPLAEEDEDFEEEEEEEPVAEEDEDFEEEPRKSPSPKRTTRSPSPKRTTRSPSPRRTRTSRRTRTTSRSTAPRRSRRSTRTTTTSTRPTSRSARASAERRWGAAEPWPPATTRRSATGARRRTPCSSSTGASGTCTACAS